MRKFRKSIIWIAGTLAAVVLGGVGLFRWMGRPLYTPGVVRAGHGLRAPLEPPPQRGAADWQVEPDIALHHFTQGRGRRVLVLHGGPGIPLTEPMAALAELPAAYQFVYYDQRGCGRSTRPIEAFSSRNYYRNVKQLDAALGIAAQLADIERIRRILGEDKIILLGHSYGGFLAALYAAEFPEHVAALVLVAPAELLLMPLKDGGILGEIGRALPPALRGEYAQYLRRYLDFSHLFEKNEAQLVALQVEFSSYYAAASTALGCRPPPPVPTASIGGWMPQAQYMSMGRAHDYRAALAAVATPVLVLHGARDLQPPEASRSYAELFPHSQFQTLAEAGHFMFLDRPKEFADAVVAFLTKVAPPNAVAGGDGR